MPGVAAAQAAALAEKAPPPAPWHRTILGRTRVWAAAVADRATQIRDRREEDRRQERVAILEAVRAMSWDGYQAMVADIFRREQYLVLAADPAEAAVIDMDVTKPTERMLVSCRLRGGITVTTEHLGYIYGAVERTRANGAYVITDGGFHEMAGDYAHQTGLILIDGETLIDLVIELTVADDTAKTLGGRIKKTIGL